MLVMPVWFDTSFWGPASSIHNIVYFTPWFFSADWTAPVLNECIEMPSILTFGELWRAYFIIATTTWAERAENWSMTNAGPWGSGLTILTYLFQASTGQILGKGLDGTNRAYGVALVLVDSMVIFRPPLISFTLLRRSVWGPPHSAPKGRVGC